LRLKGEARTSWMLKKLKWDSRTDERQLRRILGRRGMESDCAHRDGSHGIRDSRIACRVDCFSWQAVIVQAASACMKRHAVRGRLLSK
jgi:hypothetical protein